jgi:hypothetical protein
LSRTPLFVLVGVLGLLSYPPEASAAPALYSWQFASSQGQDARPGVPPQSAWTCPLSQPIKGNFTYSGERCIYHILGGQFYGKTKPERCYASEAEAQQDGCRRSGEQTSLADAPNEAIGRS